MMSKLVGGPCSSLNEYMNLYDYQMSRSFIDLGPRPTKVCSNGPGHMTKMAAINMKNSSFLEPKGRWS